MILFSPGNTPSEVKFCVPTFIKGINEFLAKEYVKNIDKANFVVVVCLSDEESEIQSLMKNI